MPDKRLHLSRISNTLSLANKLRCTLHLSHLCHMNRNCTLSPGELSSLQARFSYFTNISLIDESFVALPIGATRFQLHKDFRLLFCRCEVRGRLYEYDYGFRSTNAFDQLIKIAVGRTSRASPNHFCVPSPYRVCTRTYMVL